MLRSTLHSLVRTSRRRAVVCLSLIALGGAGGLVYRNAQRARAASVESSAPVALRFTPGATLHYAVSWSGTQRGRLFGGTSESTETHATTTVDMALSMDLLVESATGDEATLVLSFPTVERHVLNTLSSEVFPTKEHALAALVGHHARVRLGSDGVPRDVAFEPGAPDLFVNTVQWIVAQSRVSLSAGSAWDAVERGPFGESDVHYARTALGLTRTRTKYISFDAFNSQDASVTKLDGRSAITVREGVLEQVQTKETVRVDARTGGADLDAHVEFDLRLREIGPPGGAAGSAVAFGAATPAGQPVIGDAMRAELLEKRVTGMTREQLLSDLSTMGNGGVMPSHTRWLWRATGWLQKDPALARELTKAALAPGSTDKMRALVLDMFASVGHAEAQAEMRAILTSPTMTKSGARPALLQRVSFLDAPEPATVAMVWDSFRDGKSRGSSDVMTASAHSLASASRKMSKNGDAAGGRRVFQALRAEVDAAPTNASKAQLLSAFSNAGDPEVASIAKPFASSEDSGLREAAASALRKTDTREATNLLLALAGDADASVQTTALASLSERKLTASDWGALSELVAAGRIGIDLDGDMLNLAASYLGQVPVVSQVVAGIGGRPYASSATRARAGAMLAAIRG
jgi:hypothetical protein